MFQPKKSPCWWLKPGGLSKWSDWSGQSHSPAWTAPNLAGNSCRIWPWLKDGFTDTRAFTAVCAYDHAWTLAKIGTYMSFTNGTHDPFHSLTMTITWKNKAGIAASPLNPIIHPLTVTETKLRVRPCWHPLKHFLICSKWKPTKRWVENPNVALVTWWPDDLRASTTVGFQTSWCGIHCCCVVWRRKYKSLCIYTMHIYIICFCIQIIKE